MIDVTYSGGNIGPDDIDHEKDNSYYNLFTVLTQDKQNKEKIYAAPLFECASMVDTESWTDRIAKFYLSKKQVYKRNFIHILDTTLLKFRD